ncbi:hypothetical protein AVDCRST_MAG82-3045, partial [uncultured Rubrobacteraceae bacterium]
GGQEWCRYSRHGAQRGVVPLFSGARDSQKKGREREGRHGLPHEERQGTEEAGPEPLLPYREEEAQGLEEYHRGLGLGPRGGGLRV